MPEDRYKPPLSIDTKRVPVALHLASQCFNDVRVTHTHTHTPTPTHTHPHTHTHPRTPPTHTHTKNRFYEFSLKIGRFSPKILGKCDCDFDFDFFPTLKAYPNPKVGWYFFFLLRGYCTSGPYFWRLCAFSQKIKQLLTKYPMDLVRNVPRNSKITVLLQ